MVKFGSKFLVPEFFSSCFVNVAVLDALPVTQGYALRELKDDFFDRYHVLQPQAEDVEALVDYLSNMLGASQRDWQIGTSKVL